MTHVREFTASPAQSFDLPPLRIRSRADQTRARGHQIRQEGLGWVRGCYLAVQANGRSSRVGKPVKSFSWPTCRQASSSSLRGWPNSGDASAGLAAEARSTAARRSMSTPLSLPCASRAKKSDSICRCERHPLGST